MMNRIVVVFVLLFSGLTMTASPEVKAYNPAKTEYAFGNGSLAELTKHLAKVKLEGGFQIEFVKREQQLIQNYGFLHKAQFSLVKIYLDGVIADCTEVAMREKNLYQVDF